MVVRCNIPGATYVHAEVRKQGKSNIFMLRVNSRSCLARPNCFDPSMQRIDRERGLTMHASKFQRDEGAHCKLGVWLHKTRE